MHLKIQNREMGIICLNLDSTDFYDSMISDGIIHANPTILKSYKT
jgi:hypothetical protein